MLQKSLEKYLDMLIAAIKEYQLWNVTSIQTSNSKPEQFWKVLPSLKDNEIKPFYKKTGKALREAHNLQKMYKAGAFNE